MRGFMQNKKPWLLFPLYLTSLIFCACGSGSVESLVGEYSDVEGGEPQIKIINRSGVYLVAIPEKKGVWGAPEQVVECPDETVEDVFGADWSDIVENGLCMEGAAFGFFKVKKGAKADGEDIKSDYFALLMLGTGEMYRLDGLADMLLPIDPEDRMVEGSWQAKIALDGAQPGLELGAEINFDTNEVKYRASFGGQEKYTHGSIISVQEYEDSDVMNFEVDTGGNGRRKVTQYSVVIDGDSMWGRWNGEGGTGEIQATED